MSLCLILLGLCNLGAVQTFRVVLDSNGHGTKKRPVLSNLFANLTPGDSRPEPPGGGWRMERAVDMFMQNSKTPAAARGPTAVKREFSPGTVHMGPIPEKDPLGHRPNNDIRILRVDQSREKANYSQVIGKLYGRFPQGAAEATRKLEDLQKIFPIAVDWQAWTKHALREVASSLEGPVSRYFQSFAEAFRPFRSFAKALKSFRGADLTSVQSTWNQVLRIIKPQVRASLLDPLVRALSVDRNGISYKKRGSRPGMLQLSNGTQAGLLQLSNRTKDGRFLRMFVAVNFGGGAAYYIGGDVEVCAIFPIMVDTELREWWFESPDIGFGVVATLGVAQGPGVSVMIQIGVCMADDFMGWGNAVGATTGTMPFNLGAGVEFDTDWTFEGIFFEGGKQWQVSPLNQFLKIGRTFTCCGMNLPDCFMCMDETWWNTDKYKEYGPCQDMAAACDAEDEDP